MKKSRSSRYGDHRSYMKRPDIQTEIMRLKDEVKVRKIVLSTYKLFNKIRTTESVTRAIQQLQDQLQEGERMIKKYQDILTNQTSKR